MLVCHPSSQQNTVKFMCLLGRNMYEFQVYENYHSNSTSIHTTPLNALGVTTE